MEMVSRFKTMENFNEMNDIIVRDFINTLHKCRMFLDLTVEYVTLTEPREIVCGRTGEVKHFAEGDTIVILKDGTTDAINLTGNSGMANIHAIWEGICKLYDIYMPVPPKFSNDRLIEILKKTYSELECEDRDIYESIIDSLNLSDDELELIGYDKAERDCKKIIEYFSNAGYDIESSSAECFREEFGVEALEDIRYICSDETVIEEYFNDLDYEHMRVLWNCIDSDDAINEICTECDDYTRLEEDVVICW